MIGKLISLIYCFVIIDEEKYMEDHMFRNFCIVGAVLGLAGCATPEVVQERQIGDADLSCDQLIAAIDEAKQFEEDARDEREVTGTNVAAAVFFWPGLIATYANTEDAINAAEKRQEHLTELHEEKGC